MAQSRIVYNYPVYTSNGIYAPEKKVTKANFTIIGGGGGGGGGAQSRGWRPFETTYQATGGGGGGAGYVTTYTWFRGSNTEAPSYDIVIGSGGDGGTGVDNGAAGGWAHAGDGDDGNPSKIVQRFSPYWEWPAAGGHKGTGGDASDSISPHHDGGYGGSGGGTYGNGSDGARKDASYASGGSGGWNGEGYGSGGRGGNGTWADSDHPDKDGRSGSSGAVKIIETITQHQIELSEEGATDGAYISFNQASSSTTYASAYFDNGTQNITVKVHLKSGYRITGWKVTIVDQNEVTYGPSETLTLFTDANGISQSATIVAVIQRYIYNIRYYYLAGNNTNTWLEYDNSQIPASYKSYTIDNGLTLPVPPARANCNFDNGWQTGQYWSGDHTSTKVTQVPAGSTQDMEFYACWVGNRCKITLDYGTNDKTKTGWIAQDTVNKLGIANASSLPSSPQTIQYDVYNPSNSTTFNIPTDMDTVSGSVYSFDAWYLGDTNTKATPTTGYTGDYNRNGVTLKAKWYTTHVTISPNYQSDRYPGAGAGNSGIDTVEFDIKPMPESPSNYYDWTVWSGTPVCDTYDFQCWNTERNGSGNAYYNRADPSATPPHTNVMRIYQKQTTAINITLYAIWVPLYDVIITMRVNGGYWGSDTDATEDRVYYNSSTVSTRSIFLFSSTATPGEHDYVLTPINGDTPNYVNPAHADVTIQGVTYPIAFMGWDQNATSGLPAYPYNSGAGSSLLVGSGTGAIPFGANRKIELTLYASWPNSKKVTFTRNWPLNENSQPVPHTPMLYTLNNNLVTVNGEPVQNVDWVQYTTPAGVLDLKDDDGNPTLPEAIFGTYLFKGWYKVPQGQSDIDLEHDDPATRPHINEGAKIEPGEYFGNDTMVYTQWVKQFHIVFSGNNIPNWESVIRVTDINYHVDPLPVIDNEDYIVLGWFTSPSGGDQISESDPFYADTTVYAHWIPVYKVTFDPNGGECTTAVGRTNENYQLPLPFPVPVRAGYLLDTNNGQNTGWYYADRPTVPILTSTVFKRDVTVIAKWIAQSYTVTFDANGGQITIDPDSPESAWLAPITAGMRYNQIPNGDLKNGGRFPVPDSAPSGGFAFQGWSVNRYDVPAVKYTLTNPNDIFTGEYTTLYAVWTKGSNIITFDPLGGDVSPTRTYTNIDGTVTYYPTPRKTGSDFLGWYLWPIYYTANTMSDASTSQKVEEYYRDAIGAMPSDTVAHVQGTLLKSTTSPTDLQFRYNATIGQWVDVTGMSFDTVYYTTEMTITLDAQGQSSELNNYWSSVNTDGSWVKVEGTPTVTYTRNGKPFDSLDQLVEYILPSADPDTGGGMPKNNDIAQVVMSEVTLYYRFVIPYGLTVVLVREDEMNDTAYTWRQKDNVTINGVAVNGEWYDSTTDWNTVVLPGRVFDTDATLFAHWQDAVPPQVTGNICYIEKRLSRYVDNVERMYIPNVSSIEDVTTVNLTQMDTLMFGYENKYLSDLGTSRRLIVNVERPNPMPYNDNSSNPWEWSNGKWFKAFIDFTDYWQNYGRDTITGSMVGGFRFRYIPLSHDEEDDRVEFSDLYPEIDKNVFLTGNTEASFSGNLLKFTMNLAIGQMTSDSNTRGYEVLASDSGSSENKTVRLFVPEGVDLEVPQKPTTWTSPEGSMFKSWMGSDGSEYMPGSKVAFSIIANKDFKLEAQWAFNHGCIILHRDQIYYYPPTLKSMISPNENISDDGDYTISFGNGDYYYAECMVIGGGGAGAGGDQVDELLTKDNEAATAVIKFVASVTINAAAELITKSYMEAGGAGGAGELVVGNITINPYDRLRCHVGRGGNIVRQGEYLKPRYDKYISGENGEESYISHTRDDGATEMVKIPARGGYGGSGDNPYNGGSEFCAGGHGDVRNNPIDSTPGSTAATGQKGIPGTNGKDHDGGWEVVAGKQSVWFGGAGGGAVGLNTRFIVKDEEDESVEHVLGGGNNGDYYVSKGGNGANDGHSANGNSGQDPAFGGGGGSGCGGCTYKILKSAIYEDLNIPVVTHYHNPGGGAPGLIVIQLSRRYN